MNPERWSQIKTVLGLALEITEPRKRADYIGKACVGDDDLQAQVVSLIAQSSETLENCAAELQNQPAPETLANRGRRIGAFSLLRELGRGGMGDVWLAKRADGHFEQQVALKLLKRGTDTDEVLRRFRAERQILARLEHPNIARLIDGGETDQSLPYLVMEYVAGVRVTDFVQEKGLSIAERVRLFQKICHAVEFAHQHLVVHRDLKPGNILITPEGEPKLLDFGIARLLDGGDGIQHTLDTGRRLSLSSASPEQWRGETLSTVSDVYSLGALLYELLTGQPPHVFSSPHPTPLEIARVITQDEPLRPSLAAPALRRSLRGDLDTIVLRALAKEPARRYASAAALAEDLQRYLDGKPVRAQRDTTLYRTRKFILRNRVAATATALILLALLAGGATSVWQARRAERRFRDVRHLARIFLFDFHDAIAELPGSTSARRLIVASGLEYLDTLAREAGGEIELQLELAEAYLKVGDVQGKPYTANLGDSAGAIRSYEKARHIVEKMSRPSFAASSILARAHSSAGEVQTRLAQLDAARENHRSAIRVCQSILAQHPPDKKAWQQLVAVSQVGLGDAIQAGNHRQKDLRLFHLALSCYRAALPLNEAIVEGEPIGSPRVRQLAKTRSRLAGILTELGAKTGEAAYFEEAFILLDQNQLRDEALHRADPANARLARLLSDGLIARAYAHALAKTGLPGASEDCQRALALLEPLARVDPANKEAQQDLAYALYNAGLVHHVQNKWEAAAACYERGRALLAPLVAAHPENNETAFDLARTTRRLAETEAQTPPNHDL